ncbi:MAG: hypothetical protein ACI35R_12095 [Bacillus sp. (in: firmicutes)]
MNRAILAGRLARDSDLYYTSSGRAASHDALALSRPRPCGEYFHGQRSGNFMED